MKKIIDIIKDFLTDKTGACQLSLVSFILYAISLTMHTGICMETHEDFTGLECLVYGWLSIIMPPYFVLWLTHWGYLYTLRKLWLHKELPNRVLYLILASFIATILYLLHRALSPYSEPRNFACYVWSLSYMVALWAVLLRKFSDPESAVRRRYIHGAFIVIGIGILVKLGFEYQHYIQWKGHVIDARFSDFRRNSEGVFYVHSEPLLRECELDYLEGANADKLVILNENFAKDDKHVWYITDQIEKVDVASFKVSKTGVPMDKNHVYALLWLPDESNDYRPIQDSIDIASAEYFIPSANPSWGKYDNDWIRDAHHIFHRGRIVEGVDPKTFKEVGEDKYQDQYGTYELPDIYRRTGNNPCPHILK